MHTLKGLDKLLHGTICYHERMLSQIGLAIWEMQDTAVCVKQETCLTWYRPCQAGFALLQEVWGLQCHELYRTYHTLLWLPQAAAEQVKTWVALCDEVRTRANSIFWNHVLVFKGKRSSPWQVQISLMPFTCCSFFLSLPPFLCVRSFYRIRPNQ